MAVRKKEKDGEEEGKKKNNKCNGRIEKLIRQKKITNDELQYVLSLCPIS